MCGEAARLTDSDSRAPSGWLVIVKVAEDRLALSTSLTVALAPRLTGPEPTTLGEESSTNAALESMPALAPFRSTTGGALTTWIVAVVGGLAAVFEPSLATKLTTRSVVSAFWLVSRYLIVRSTFW